MVFLMDLSLSIWWFVTRINYQNGCLRCPEIYFDISAVSNELYQCDLCNLSKHKTISFKSDFCFQWTYLCQYEGLLRVTSIKMDVYVVKQYILIYLPTQTNHIKVSYAAYQNTKLFPPNQKNQTNLSFLIWRITVGTNYQNWRLCCQAMYFSISAVLNGSYKRWVMRLIKIQSYFHQIDFFQWTYLC